MEIKSKKQKLFGFTLIELVVAIAIMGMLATIVLAGFSKGNKRRSVVLGADTVISVIRTAQNDSLSPQAIPNDSCAPDSIPVEYRLDFNSSSTSVLLRAKDKCNNFMTVGTYPMPDKVRIASGNNLKLDNTGVGASGGLLSIKFVPPFAATTGAINSATYIAYKQISITVETKDASANKTVTLDGISGKVDTQ